MRERLAALNHCQPEEIIVDAGADSLILLALRLCVNPATPWCTAGSYPTFRYFAEGVGAQLRKSSTRRMLAACARTGRAGGGGQCRTGGAALPGQPGQPTGHLWSGEVVAQLRAALNPDTLLLLDEAYLTLPNPPSAGRWPAAGVLRLRTLSKAYALAGARVGYAFG